MLYNHQHYLVPEHFDHPQRKPLTQWAVTPHPPAPTPWQLLTCYLSLWICLFWIFPINGIRQYVALCAWLFSLSITRLICISSLLYTSSRQTLRKDFPLFIFSKSSCPLTLTTMAANQLHCDKAGYFYGTFLQCPSIFKPISHSRICLCRKALPPWWFVVFASVDCPSLLVADCCSF